MTYDHRLRTRRDFLRDLGRGAAGIGLGAPGFAYLSSRAQGCETAGPLPPPSSPRLDPARQLYRRAAPPARVALVKGTNRRDMVYRSLKLIEDEIVPAIRGREVWIKPNVVTPINPLGSLHVDAMRGILDFLAPHYDKTIVIGESATLDTRKGFENYGYLTLEKDYNVKLVDLNRTGAFEYRYVIDKDNRPIPIRIGSAFLARDRFMISAAPMKTHNIVLVTLSLKNVLLGAPLNDYTKNDKGLMHTSSNSTANDICHYNMFHLAQDVFPDLAVIDGFQAMEGKGPAWGTPIDARVVVAGRDPVAADTLATKVMGFDVRKVGYLSAMADAGMGQGDTGKITVLGSTVEECQCRFKPDDATAEKYGIRK